MGQKWTWTGTNFSIELEEASFDAETRTATLKTVVYRKSSYTTLGGYILRLGIPEDTDHVSYFSMTTTQLQVCAFNFTVAYPEDAVGLTLTVTPTITTNPGGAAADSFSVKSCALTPMPLDIPAPTLSANSVNFGSSITITTTDPDSTSLKYDIGYSFGSASGSIGTNLSAGAKSWTVANSLMEQIPASTKGDVSISVSAKNSAGDVMGTWTLRLTANVPQSVVPTVSTIYVDASVMPGGIAGFVQGKSKIGVLHTAEGVYGSFITSCRSTVDGVVYDGTSFTTNLIKSSGTVAVNVTVTDSRGRSASRTSSFTVYAYSSPKITSVSAYRCTSSSSSTAKADGTYICVKPLGSITSLSDTNSRGCTVYYKKATDQDYTGVAVITSDYTLDSEYVIFAADINSSYDIYVELTDSFSTTRYVCPQVSSGGAYIHIPPGRDGIGFGKRMEESGALETAWKIKSNGDIIADADGTGTSLLDSSKRLGNYFSARPSTLDIEHESNGGVVSFKSTSAANDSGTKPGGYDAHILHFFWDNNGKYDSQLAVPNRYDRSLYRRAQDGNTWGDWVTIMDSNNFKTFFTSAVMEELMAAMEMTTGTVSLISGKAELGTYGNFNVCKVGKLVELNAYNVKTSAGLAADEAFATIPDGFRPVNAFVTNIIQNSASGGEYRVLVGGTGNISFREAASLERTIHLRAFYYTA